MESPRPQQLFNEAYPFFTASSEYMKLHFENMAKEVLKYDPKFILEIGGNDGTFLKNFVGSGVKLLNIEPSVEQAGRSNKKGIDTLNIFCTPRAIDIIEEDKGVPDIVVATNTFCHIPDLFELLKRLSALKPKPIIIFEDPYLGDIVKKAAYDQFYDEHIFYFSITSINWIARRLGYGLLWAHQPTHGGSMRYTMAPREVGRPGRFEEEHILGLDSYETMVAFGQQIRENKQALEEAISRYVSRGLIIAAYGATSKSTTILNYCNIADYIKYIVDSTPEKQGRRTPGSDILIVPPEFFRACPPDVCLMLAWNHWAEIQAKENWYQGEWIHPHDPS
jgi:methylation protein EvaC